MLIYICCAGGMTSSMFCQKIARAADPNAIYFGYLHDIINDFEALNTTYPLLIAYGGEGEITEQTLIPVFDPYVDHVLVCPQVRYRTALLKKMLEPLNISCTDLDMRIFGNMDGKKALDDLLLLQKREEI